MNKFITKLVYLYKSRRIKRETPITAIEDYLSQLAVLYAYTQSEDYRESQRDIVNLRIAEIRYEIIKQLNKVSC